MQVISVKKALEGTLAPDTQVEVRGWVRTRRDSKAGLSFVNVSDGSAFDPIQVVAPNYAGQLRERGPAAHRRLRAWCAAARSCSPRARASRSRCRPRRSRWSAGWRTRTPTRSSPSGTRWSSCARWPTCARAPTPSAPSRACATPRPRRSTASSTSTASSGSTRRSSPPATPRAPAQMFRVSTLDLAEPAAHARRQGRLRQGLLRQGGPPHRARASSTSRPTAWRCRKVYTFGPTFRAENSNTTPPPRRVLDDRAGDRVRRPRRRRRPRRGASSSTSSRRCSTERADDMAFFEERVDKDVHRARWRSSSTSSFARMDYTEAIDDPREASRQEVRVPGEVGHRPAVRARALPHRGARRPAGRRDELPEGHQGVLHAPERRREDRRRDGRAGARHRRDHRRQPARGAARRARRAHGRDAARTRRTTGGTATCAATAPCRTRASASASSGSSSTCGLQNIRDVIPFPRAPGSAQF